MHAARRLFTTVISFLLIGGLVCARICDMRCDYTASEYPHSSAASGKTNATQVPPSDHCHQDEGEPDSQDSPPPVPFGDDHSSNCQIHAVATAAEISVKAKSLHLIKIPSVEVYHGVNVSFDQLSGIINLNQVFRSPPAGGTYSVLRI